MVEILTEIAGLAIVALVVHLLMLQTDQHLPRLGSQSGTVETNPDGSTDIYFGPTAPEGMVNNWLQTVAGNGWWVIVRLYNPLQSFFDKTWQPSEIELI